MTDNQPNELAAACRAWQGGRDIGSTPLRGAARVLTGVPHYFQADFITKQEDNARVNPDVMRAADVLLSAVADAPHRTGNEWNAVTGLHQRGFVGRGLEPKPEFDDQILEALATDRLVMPLWGVSLNWYAAWWFGTGGRFLKPRFLFEIEGPFPAVPAWMHSGEKADQEELICGGEYAVRGFVHHEGPLTTVTLAYTQPITAT